jgi:O-antigen biosynthesis protein
VCVRLDTRMFGRLYAEMNHHESASRGIEDSPAKPARFYGEQCFMQSRWGRKLFDDPAYSPSLTMDCEDFFFALPPRINPI